MWLNVSYYRDAFNAALESYDKLELSDVWTLEVAAIWELQIHKLTCLYSVNCQLLGIGPLRIRAVPKGRVTVNDNKHLELVLLNDGG